MASVSIPDTGNSSKISSDDINSATSDFERLADKEQSEIVVNTFSDVWNRIRQDLAFNRNIERPEVQEKLAWYTRNQDYLDRVVDRARPYLYYIVEQLDKRQMPLDLALLPIIESAYQPFAYSPARASGIWQFMPRTGTHYGLKQNWWYDGRRDIVAATNAALDYLQKLENEFNGDWLLVIAAYNSGEGNVSRAIRKNQSAGKPTDFFSLGLPRETRGYVPSLLAVAEIVANTAKYQVNLGPISNQPYFSQINIDGQIDLALAADLSNLSMDDLYTLNPGFNRWATDPEGPHKLLIPTDKAEAFTLRLAQIPQGERISWQRHVIREGESLGLIANRYHTDISTLKQANGLTNNLIRTGRSLLIPSSKEPAKHYTMSQDSRRYRGLTRTDGNKYLYTVQKGDNLWDISRRYGVSVKNLTDWNGLSTRDYLHPKQNLTLWVTDGADSKTSSTSTNVAISDSITGSINYTVKSGDSLWMIARRFDTHVKSIQTWNNLSTRALIQPGQVLVIKDNENEVDVPIQSSSPTNYIVRRGDSLWLIARRFNTTVKKLRAWNNLPANKYLQPGQTLVLHPQEA